MTDPYVLEVDWEDAGPPLLLGPFDTRQEAEEFARLNVGGSGSWRISQLTFPYHRGRV